VTRTPRLPQGTRFEFQRLLGTGGMSEVSLAWDRQLERNVAVKRLRVSMKDLRRRIQREASALGSLEHPHLIRLYDHIEEEEQTFLVLEYVPGVSIGDWRNRQDTLPMMLAIADALEEIHAQGLVHRDVKPDNIMVTPEGRAVLLDLGLVLDPERTRISKTGAVLGTPAYLPPEQIATKHVKPAADWYSWGATLFHLLEGRPAFEWDEFVARAPGGTLPDLRFESLPPGDSRAEVIRQCMDFEPARRPHGRAALEEILGGTPAPPGVGLADAGPQAPAQNSSTGRASSQMHLGLLLLLLLGVGLGVPLRDPVAVAPEPSPSVPAVAPRPLGPSPRTLRPLAAVLPVAPGLAPSFEAADDWAPRWGPVDRLVWVDSAPVSAAAVLRWQGGGESSSEDESGAQLSRVPGELAAAFCRALGGRLPTAAEVGRLRALGLAGQRHVQHERTRETMASGEALAFRVAFDGDRPHSDFERRVRRLPELPLSVARATEPVELAYVLGRREPDPLRWHEVRQLLPWFRSVENNLLRGHPVTAREDLLAIDEALRNVGFPEAFGPLIGQVPAARSRALPLGLRGPLPARAAGWSGTALAILGPLRSSLREARAAWRDLAETGEGPEEVVAAARQSRSPRDFAVRLGRSPSSHEYLGAWLRPAGEHFHRLLAALSRGMRAGEEGIDAVAEALALELFAPENQFLFEGHLGALSAEQLLGTRLAPASLSAWFLRGRLETALVRASRPRRRSLKRASRALFVALTPPDEPDPGRGRRVRGALHGLHLLLSQNRAPKVQAPMHRSLRRWLELDGAKEAARWRPLVEAVLAAPSSTWPPPSNPQEDRGPSP
jgi:serine/threonine-protein kinase